MSSNCIPELPNVWLVIVIFLSPAFNLIPPVPIGDFNTLPSICHPAICPPVNNTEEPVIWPLDDNIKFFDVALIVVESNSNPPIVPPVNNTCEPVISPEALNIKESSVLEIAIGLRSVSYTHLRAHET